MKWWQRVFGADDAAAPLPQRSSDPPRWLPPGDPDNPFDVRVLSLMGNLQMTSFSSNAEVARCAMSWRAGEHARLRWELVGERIDCRLAFRVEGSLPDGLLFTPGVMEDKWVLAHRAGRLALARSWSGDTQLIAEAEVEGDTLTVTRLTVASDCPLGLLGDPVRAFQWLIETHALQQRVPFPASGAGAELLQTTPVTAMSLYGHRLFCAALDYEVPASGRPLRSDGELVAAVLAADEARVRAAIAAGQALSQPSTLGGNRPLHLAVATQRAPLVQLLVDAGADIDCEDDKRFRPLHAAAEVGNIAAMRLLVSHGAQRDRRTVDGLTPFHIACALGQLDAAKELQRLGADTNASSPHGTGLEIARREGRLEIVAWLQGLN